MMKSIIKGLDNEESDLGSDEGEWAVKSFR